MKRFSLILLILISHINSYSQSHIIRGGDNYEGMGILRIDNIEASSYLIDKSKSPDTYAPVKSSDGKPETSWVEGVKGPGIGEWLKINFYGGHIAYKMVIINGFAKNKMLYFANNRVKKLLIEYSEGQKKEVTLKDGILDYQNIMLDKIYAKWIKLTIIDVYKGSKFNDTCIAEIELDHWDKD